SPIASSRCLDSRPPEGCPSGQREQAVNLPAYAYAGSNPAPSTLLSIFVGPQPHSPGADEADALRVLRDDAGPQPGSPGADAAKSLPDCRDDVGPQTGSSGGERNAELLTSG